MTSTIKVDNIQKVSDGSNIIKKCGSTITIGSCGQTVAIASGATTSGMGRTGTVDWQTSSIKTATFTAVSGEGYFCNTAGGTFEVDLPAGSAGAIVSIQDYNNTFDTVNLTVDPNGSEKINGGTDGEPITLDTEGRGVTLVYIDATVGWRSVQDNDFIKAGTPPASFVAATGGTILTNGNFKTHVFTSPGTFAVSGAGNTYGSNKLDYFVVAGGGSGGYYHRGSGGGAGGFRLSNSVGCAPAPTMSPLANPTSLTATVASFPVVIGAGGATPTGCTGNNGSVSTFSSITSAGGGSGAGCGPTAVRSQAGGSGGGRNSNTAGGPGSAGNTPPVSPPQGNPGGGISYSAPNFGGGGGGAGAAGTDNSTFSPRTAATGGIGSFIADAFMGPTAPSYGESGPVSNTRYFAGGGGAGSYPMPSAVAGGIGGGGDGGYGSPYVKSTGGSTNMGGGGGGQAGPTSPADSAGGSGIVMIRYKFQ